MLVHKVSLITKIYFLTVFFIFSNLMVRESTLSKKLDAFSIYLERSTLGNEQPLDLASLPRLQEISKICFISIQIFFNESTWSKRDPNFPEYDNSGTYI